MVRKVGDATINVVGDGKLGFVGMKVVSALVLRKPGMIKGLVH